MLKKLLILLLSLSSTSFAGQTITGNLSVSGLSANTIVLTNSSKQLISGSTALNNEQTISYQPGLLTAVNATIGVYGKFVYASTVDNIIGSAVTFSCVANPTITMYECGASTTCNSPTTIGTVTVTTAGTAVTGTINNAAIAAGDYVGWAITAGTCASIDISGTAQIHSN